MELKFEATMIEWRGPAPYLFLPVPAAESEGIRAAARLLSYGWGVIPVSAIADGVSFTTSLFPKDGHYLLPVKDAVRRQIGVTVGDRVAVAMSLGRGEMEGR